MVTVPPRGDGVIGASMVTGRRGSEGEPLVVGAPYPLCPSVLGGDSAAAVSVTVG